MVTLLRLALRVAAFVQRSLGAEQSRSDRVHEEAMVKVSQDDERHTLVELLAQLGARFEDAELHATGSVTLNLEDGKQISIPVDAVGWVNAVLRFVLDQQVANEGRQVPEMVRW